MAKIVSSANVLVRAGDMDGIEFVQADIVTVAKQKYATIGGKLVKVEMVYLADINAS